jgi:hypothetical protein
VGHATVQLYHGNAFVGMANHDVQWHSAITLAQRERFSQKLATTCKKCDQ